MVVRSQDHHTKFGPKSATRDSTTVALQKCKEHCLQEWGDSQIPPPEARMKHDPRQTGGRSINQPFQSLRKTCLKPPTQIALSPKENAFGSPGEHHLTGGRLKQRRALSAPFMVPPGVPMLPATVPMFCRGRRTHGIQLWHRYSGIKNKKKTD